MSVPRDKIWVSFELPNIYLLPKKLWQQIKHNNKHRKQQKQDKETCFFYYYTGSQSVDTGYAFCHSNCYCSLHVWVQQTAHWLWPKQNCVIRPTGNKAKVTQQVGAPHALVFCKKVMNSWLSCVCGLNPTPQGKEIFQGSESLLLFS